MGPTLVDSNIVLDVATNDPRFAAWSAAKLATLIRSGDAVINPLIYAEVAAGYETTALVELVLPVADYRREDLPWEAAALAGRAFRRYRRSGGQKRSPLPDFYIGAHALVTGMKLLTRDVQRYRTYFPEVELITPPPHLI